MTGIRYEGRVFVLLQYDAGSTERADQIKTQLGVSGAVAAVPVEGSLETHMDDTMSAQDVQFSLQVISEGFVDDDRAAGAQEPGSPLSGVTLTQANLASISAEIDGAYRALLASVSKDACRDLGPNRDGTANLCDGAPSPGYQNNTVRHARVAGVELSTYAPEDDVATQNYLRLLRRLDEVEDFARLHSQVENKIEDVVSMELEPFLATRPSNRSRYNVAPPGSPVFSLAELSNLGEHWHEVFRSHGVDNIVDPLQSAVGVCWREAALGEFTNCPRCSTGNLNGCRALDVAIKRLEEYENASRILPVELEAVSPQLDWGWAQSACLARGLTLPDASQIQYLSLAVAQGSAAFCDQTRPYCDVYADPDRQYLAWFDPINGAQGCDPKTQFSMFYNPPNQPPATNGDGAQHFICQDRCDNFLGIGCPADDAATFCIYPSGPFGRIPVIL